MYNNDPAIKRLTQTSESFMERMYDELGNYAYQSAFRMASGHEYVNAFDAGATEKQLTAPPAELIDAVQRDAALAESDFTRAKNAVDALRNA